MVFRQTNMPSGTSWKPQQGKWPELREQKAQEPICAGDRPATTQLYRPGLPGGQHTEHKPGMCLWQRQPGQPGLL